MTDWNDPSSFVNALTMTTSSSRPFGTNLHSVTPNGVLLVRIGGNATTRGARKLTSANTITVEPCRRSSAGSYGELLTWRGTKSHSRRTRDYEEAQRFAAQLAEQQRQREQAAQEQQQTYTAGPEPPTSAR